MLTNIEINDFKATIIYRQSQVGLILIKLLAINGRQENEEEISKYELIDIYCDIMLDYFVNTDYISNNFFTTDEFQDVLRNFNTLCSSDYNLNL